MTVDQNTVPRKLNPCLRVLWTENSHTSSLWRNVQLPPELQSPNPQRRGRLNVVDGNGNRPWNQSLQLSSEFQFSWVMFQPLRSPQHHVMCSRFIKVDQNKVPKIAPLQHNIFNRQFVHSNSNSNRGPLQRGKPATREITSSRSNRVNPETKPCNKSQSFNLIELCFNLSDLPNTMWFILELFIRLLQKTPNTNEIFPSQYSQLKIISEFQLTWVIMYESQVISHESL